MWRRLLVLSWLLAMIALLIVIAILTGILVQGEQIEAVQSSFVSHRTLPRIPWYLFYAAYLFGTLTSTLAILLVQNLRIVRDSPREYQKVKWLLVGSGVSLLGMTIAVVIQPLAKGFVPVQLGMFGIITGVGIIGYGIVNHNTMMREQVLKQDFQHSLLIDTLLARATEEATKQPTATPVATAPAQSSQHSTAVERNSGEPSFSQSRVFLPLISSTENQVGSVQGKTDESVQSAATTAVYKAYLPLIVSPHIVDFTKLQRGDLLFRMGKTGDFTLTNYAMIFSHNAFYDGNLKTYESNIDIGGVRRLALSTWQLPVFTALLRATGKNKNGVSLTSTVVQGALDWAENKWGFTSTGYNIWITDKNTDARLYCSQLAWKTFGYIQTEVNSESQLVEDFLINKFG